MSGHLTAEDPARTRKRSINVGGHATSVSLEGVFWQALGDIAAARGLSLTGLVSEIDRQRSGPNLSSSLRVFVLEWYMTRDK